MDDFYRPGHRALQDQFDSRRLADRLEEVTLSPTLSERDSDVIAGAPFFWLATADADGWPDVSYKGGHPGFVKVLDEKRLAFPSYDGNGMFRSLGNIVDNPRIGLLFCDFNLPWRVRVKGRATVVDDPAILADWEGAELAVEVQIETVFPNCDRYLHTVTINEISPNAPAPGHSPPEAKWKSYEKFDGYLPKAP